MSNLDIQNKSLKKRLPNIKTLSMLKMEKNFIAFNDKGYPRQPYLAKQQTTTFLIGRIEEELEEMKEAHSDSNIQVMKEECADIINLCEYLFEKLMRRGENNK